MARFLCAKSALRGFCVMRMLGRSVFLISCLSDALGFWVAFGRDLGFCSGLLRCGGVLVCGCMIWFCLIYVSFQHFIFASAPSHPGCSKELAAVGHLRASPNRRPTGRRTGGRAHLPRVRWRWAASIVGAWNRFPVGNHRPSCGATAE